MAVPLRQKPVITESATDLHARLDEARVKHAEAILAAYELLQELHDAGVLDLCRGALGAGDTIVTKAALAINSPEAINSFRNIVSLVKILSSFDPEFLHRLSQELSHSKRPKPQKVGAWRFARMVFGADARRAITGAAAFLQAFGRALASP
jgi:uncharacterized protein YjgD (DUF1641 family)